MRRDLTGQTFERLTAQWPVGYDATRKNCLWLCSCVCGNLSIVSVSNLRFGRQRSCGCLFVGCQTGKILSQETREKIKVARAKQVTTVETRLKMSATHKAQREQSNFWRGGITSISAQIRHSVEYKLWRDAVYARDNWTCQECGQRGGSLHAHHIKSFANFPELRFVVANGKTLCENCHGLTDTFAWKSFHLTRAMEERLHA